MRASATRRCHPSSSTPRSRATRRRWRASCRRTRNISTRSPRCALTPAPLRPPRAHPFAIPQDTYTLLHLASEGTEPGHTACVAMLLANGADPGAVDADGQSALHLATASGSLPTVRLLTKGDCPQLLLADKYQMTPFHLACESGYDDMVQYLLSMFKIDPEMRRGARAPPPPPHTPRSPPTANPSRAPHRLGAISRAEEQPRAGGEHPRAHLAAAPRAAAAAVAGARTARRRRDGARRAAQKKEVVLLRGALGISRRRLWRGGWSAAPRLPARPTSELCAARGLFV